MTYDIDMTYKSVLYIYLDPAKDVFFSGEGNFQAKLKKPTQQTVLVSIFVTSALFFVTSASCWRHVFYREFAACFCVMFSGETEKKTSFQGPGIYTGLLLMKLIGTKYCFQGCLKTSKTKRPAEEAGCSA